MQRIVVCIDDTDDLTKETSTGAVAEALARTLTLYGGQLELDVTRHQLLLDPRVPYTSHNSAMAFTALMPNAQLDAFMMEAQIVVQSMMAPSADPGLCVGVVPSDDPWVAMLAEYGRRAQKEYIEIAEAYALAEKVPWLTLQCLGGDESGVVGALAGAGLRLGGEDGRFRGKWVIDASGVENAKNRWGGGGDGKGKERAAKAAKLIAGQTLPLREVIAGLQAKVSGPVFVESLEGESFPEDALFEACAEAKPVLRHGALVLLARRGDDGLLHALTKDSLDALDRWSLCAGEPCEHYERDNDEEELHGDIDVAGCGTCLFRRVTADAFACMSHFPSRVF